MILIAVLAILILFFCSFFIGSLIVHFLRLNEIPAPFFRVMLKLISGVIFISFGYSVCKTQMLTVQWGFLIPVIFYLVFAGKLKGKINFNLKAAFCFNDEKKPLILAFIFAILFFSFYSWMYFSSNPPAVLHFDEVYYSVLSYKMNLFQVETIRQLNFDSNTYSSPYHYSELWLNALMFSVFKLNPIFVFSVIIKSFFSSVIIIGMLSLTLIFTSNRLLLIAACFSIFISSFLLDYSFISQAGTNAHQTKFMIAVPFYIMFLFMEFKKSPYSFFPLSILPVLNIAFAPVIFPVISILIFWKLIKGNFVRSSFITLIAVSLTILFIGLFYYMQQNSESKGITHSASYLANFYQLGFFFADLVTQSKDYFMYLPFFLPLFLLLAFSFFRDKLFYKEFISKYQQIYIILILCMIIGNIVQFFLFPFAGYDAGQINYLNYLLLINIMSFLSLLIVYKKVESKNRFQKRAYLLYVSLLMIYCAIIFIVTKFNFIQKPEEARSVHYITSVTEYHKKNNYNNIGGIIFEESEFKLRNKHDLNNAYWFSAFSTSIDFFLIKNLNIYQNDSNLNNSEAIITRAIERDNLFNKYFTVAEMAEYPLKVSNMHDSAQLNAFLSDYINKNKISFVVLQKNVHLPELLIPEIDTIFTDGISGEQFVFLKK
ncbi:MAG: hypothetical protein A2W91_12290 [Bacteroidetes bacterium GWF2_38_335]|nr:MAG: hypothetical protein A2W91_12290 [Bacteroidetes bacterium GWF2_38_335]OFY76949.1 MAG: hypothetical protein A2281_00405 [Bacteroidetes bacterium RIFOXYA12_FULL_38_20]HBS86802.1 hypothetical protein [Bacteroidales bacterium]